MLLVCLDVGSSWVGAGSEQRGSETPGRVAFSLSLGTGDPPALLWEASLCFFLSPAVLVCCARWGVVRVNGTVHHKCGCNQRWMQVTCIN